MTMEIVPIAPHVHGWLQTKLSDVVIKHLWDGIGDDHEVNDKGNMFWANVVQPHINAYGERINHEHTKIPLNGEFQTHLDKLSVCYHDKHEWYPFYNENGMYSFIIWMKIPTYHKEQNELSNAKNARMQLNSAFTFQYLDTLGDIITHSYEMNPDMEGTMLFFPSKMMYSINPFYECDDQRISIIGNVKVR